ncbi:MAG: dltA [Bacillales bacterium]|nr:dltA [Bacillales bacterium]
MELLNQIKQNAVIFPDKVAFQSRNGCLTYSELLSKSEALAIWISERESSKRPIIVYGNMQPEMVICFLAAALSGHPYVPIDESIPVERVKQIIEKSGAKMAFVSPIFSLDCSLEIFLFEELDRLVSSVSYSGAKKLFPIEGNDTFYIIFTSGSTGAPKGVEVSANNLDSFVKWIVDDFSIGKNKTFLNQPPFSFDLSVMDLYPSLATGGTLIALDKDLLASMKDLFPYLIEGKLNVWTSTPSFIEICLMNKSFNAHALPTLETFLFCGEIMPSGTAKELRKRFPDAKIFNTYGPTEATVAITYIEITDEILGKYPTLPIGYAKRDTQIFLVDEEGIEAENGEIIITGSSVANGYLNDSEKTAAVFFDKGQDRAYRTGDVGTFKNGMLFYHGRKDFQIKLHGYRIELEDIEANLREVDLIENGIVVPVFKDNAITELVAVVVARDHDFKKEFQLTSFIKKQLSERMPTYMIPRRFVYWKMLPMTNNGKIDRKLISAQMQPLQPMKEGYTHG